MKKIFALTALGMAAGAVCVAAWAANISNISGQSCGASTGTWHFINNQTGGTQVPGTLMATWDSGNACTVSSSKVLSSVQHFYCTASGGLTSASTNLPGRLVLSDFTCDTKEPPTCDPKTDPKCP